MNITESKIALTTTKVVPRTGLDKGYTSLDWFEDFSICEKQIFK